MTKVYTTCVRLISVLALVFVFAASKAQVDITATGGSASASYTTLKGAFDAINAGTHTGVITINISANTIETASAVLNASGVGSSSYTSIGISPSGARTISGAIVAGSPLIDMNGADNVTINGLNTGGNSLIISNTTASATIGTSTVRFIGGATGNIITNCTVLGSFSATVATSGGNIFFSTDATTTNGNDNNTISNNNIGPAGSNLSTKGIYASGSTGTVAIGNSGITISNNNIYDYFGAAVSSAGVYVSGGNIDWTITSNKFYQTATRTQTTGAQHSAIWITNTTANTSGNNFIITNNTIGYASNTGTGTYNFVGVSSASVLIPIYLSVPSTSNATSVQGNTITAIAMSGAVSGTSSSGAFRGIYVAAGLTNIGDITGNIIGSLTSNGAITFTSSSTSASDVMALFNFGSADWNVSNNQIGGITAANSSTGVANVYGIRFNTAAAANTSIINNIIGGTVSNSLQSTSTATGSQVVGIFSSTSIGTITGNTIRNLTAAGGTGTTTAASVVGIAFVSTSVNNSVSQNTIHTLTNTNASAATTVTGIQYTSSTGTNSISRNFIHSFSVASTTAIVNGIQATAGTATYSNNMIRLGLTSSGSSVITGAVMNGINEVGGTNNFYYNSIYIGGTGVGGTAATFAFTSSATTNTRNYKNNIFSNERSNSGGTGKHYSIKVAGTAANPAGLTINNNNYFVSGTGGVFGSFNSADVVNLAGWKTAVGQDAASVNGDPKYLSSTGATPNLHINSAVTTTVESAGIPLVDITIDYDGDPRGNSYTDIGADEGNFIPITDLYPPDINYLSLANTCSTGDRTFTARITDATGVPTTGNFVPRVWYKKSATGNWFSNAGTLSSGSATDGIWSFTLLASDLNVSNAGEQIYYYVIAQDVTGSAYLSSNPSGVVANDVTAVTTHPAAPNFYLYASLAGNYTVGSGGAYSTLTAAVNVYNIACLTGAVTFTLTDVTYSANETFPIIINANPYASVTNTLTLIPAVNTSVNITGTSGTSASALIKLDGADYVTIDGIHDAGGTNLTIENTSVTTGTAALWLASSGAGQGATNNTIKNITLKAGADQKATTTTTYGIVIAGSTLSGTITSVTAGADNDNNVIDTCTIQKVRYGIYTRGASTTNPNIGTVIKRNIIGAASFGINEIGKAGIVAREEDGIQIINNEIKYVGGDYINNPAASATARAGIALSTDATWTPTSVFVKNALINANIIHDIQDEKVGAALGIILSGVDGTNATNNIISNNFIYNIKANGIASSNQAVGIGINNGNADKVVFNSIYMSGNVNASAGATTATIPSFGIRVSSASATNLSILNNVVYMDISSGAATPKNYCIDIPAASYAWGTGNLDYNNWYANITNSQSAVASVNNGATGYTTLPLWQAATSKDANSKDYDPKFVDLITTINLHLDPSSPLDGQGIPVSGVTKDFDNQIRSATSPDMGADELPAAAGLDLKPQDLISPAVSLKGCYNTEPVTVAVKNNGGSTVNFAGNNLTVTLNVSGATTASYTKIINTGSLAGGALLNVSIDPVGLDMSIPGVYQFEITTSISGDATPANDQLLESRTKEALNAGAASATPTEYCQTGGKPVLSSTGANGYSSLQWVESATSGSGYTNIIGATNTSFTVASNITQSTFYKLIATCGSAPPEESGEVIVVLNNPQPLTTTPATRCGIGTVTLGATADAGNSVRWYAASTGGAPLTTGGTFITPTLANTTTYYVEVSQGGGGGTHVVGAGATTSATYSNPFYSLWSNAHDQYIIRASELNAAGIFAGNITALGIDITVAGTLPMIDFSMKLGSTSATDVSSYVSTTFTTVYTSASLMPTTGLNTLAFTTPFAWDGSSNLVIEICHGNPSSTATMSRTALMDATSYISTIHTHKTSSTGGTAQCSDNATNVTTYSVRPKFTFTTAGCSGTRVAVVATVTPAAALTVTADKTICNNSVHQLQVTSTLSDFDSYVWSPSTGLFLDAAATSPYTPGTNASTVYVKNSTAGTTSYNVTATNSTTNCANQAISSVTVMPAPTVSASPATICVSGTSTISADPASGYGAGTLQWQSSTDGVAAYTDISGATTSSYQTPTLTQSAYYKFVLKDGIGFTCAQITQNVVVNNPQVGSTTPATRCGVGTVILGATANSGNSLAWYAASSGGTSLGTGTTFNTPVLNSTTTYYVAAGNGASSATTGLPVVSSNPTSGAGTTNFGLVFDALTGFTLNTVTIYPISSTGATGTVTIDVINSAGTVVHTATVNVTGSPIGSPQPQIVTLNFNIQPGTNYKLRPGARTGITGLAFEPSAGAPPGGNYGYPFVVPGVLSINTSTLTAAPTNTANPDLYYYFYNWQVSVGCEGVRSPVVATITAPPTLTVTANKTICNNSIHSLQVTSTISDFDTYNWSPSTGLFTDAAATTPYTAGTSATQVYVKTSAAGTTTYTVTATNTTSNCVNVATSTVTVMPNPSIASTPAEICMSGSATLAANPATGYGTGTLQWQSSPDGISAYSDISGANNAAYTTPTLTQTAYYRLIVKDGVGASCNTVLKSMVVNNPQVTGTTPGSRCGSGTVTLGATATGGNINWYTTPTGGTPVATGNSFITPVLTTTTPYYVTASQGLTQASLGLTDRVGATTNTGYTDIGLMFDATVAFTLNSVSIYPVGSGGNATVTIELRNSAGTVLQTTTATVATSASPGIKTLVPLNFNVPVGTGHRLVINGATGLTGLIRELTTGFTYPYTYPGVASITSAYTSGASSSYYYYLYDWKISVGCESSRTSVIATVTAGPSVSVTADKTICNDAVHSLQVTSTISDFDNYAWSPSTGLYTDAAATIPYTGTNASQVYVKTATAGSKTYTLTANNSSTTCGSVATSTVIVMPQPTISASDICMSGSTTLVASPATGYGAGTLQWQSSPDGIAAYSNISSATTNSYITPTLTQNGYYRLVIKDGAGTACTSVDKVAIVANPQVTGTTPGSRCGTGSVSLSASASAGATLNWYAASTGGSILNSGTSFTTPSISTNTNYYVSASQGAGGVSAVGPVNPTSLGAPSSSTIAVGTQATFFDVLNSSVTIQSVDIFPTATVGSTFAIVILNSSATQVFTTGNLTTSVTGGNLQTVVLNATLPQGTNYKIGLSTNPGMNRVITGAVYPYTLAGIISITGNTFDPDYFYFTYNWKIVTGCESARTAVTATVNLTASNAAGAAGTTECATKTISGTTEFNYTDCDLIGIIAPRTGTPISGSVGTCVKIDNSIQTAPTGEPYVQRHYDITPATNATTATSTITLYFLQSEFDAFNLVRGIYPALPANGSDAIGKANLRITQYNGSGTAPGNYSGTAIQIDPADANIVWNNSLSRWEVTFNATGSGGFYVHTGNFVLPVTITNFRGEQAGSVNKLYWNTSTETNNKGFELERSADGASFTKITFVATKANGGNSTSALSYNFDDVKPMAGANYYRLKQVDNDGRYSYSNVVLLTRKITEITLTGVYPNPTTRELNVKITSPRSEKLTIVVTDLTGKIVMQTPADVVVGDNQKQLNVIGLAAGTYVVKAICANGCETAVHRFVKQ